MPALDRPSAISAEHLGLARRQRGRAGRSPAADRAAARRPRGRARCRRRRPGDRVEELRDVGDPVLEQVADALGVAGDAGRSRSAPRRTGEARAPRPRGYCARMTSAARTPSSVWVGGIRTSTTHDVRAVLGDRAAAAGRRRRRGDDLEAGVGEQVDEALAQQDRVLGDHDAHGTSTVDGSARRRRACEEVPSTAATRSRRPASPQPRGGVAPPMPSSETDDQQPVAVALARERRPRVALGVLGDVGERLGDDEVGDGLDGSASGRDTRSTSSGPAPAQRAASAGQGRVQAAVVRTAGWMPRTTSRSSAMESLASWCAWAISSRAPLGVAVQLLLGPPAGSWPARRAAAGRRRAGRARSGAARRRSPRRSRPCPGQQLDPQRQLLGAARTEQGPAAARPRGPGRAPPRARPASRAAQRDDPERVGPPAPSTQPWTAKPAPSGRASQQIATSRPPAPPTTRASR